MPDKSNDGRVDYIEFPAADIGKTKLFYGEVFGWKFTGRTIQVSKTVASLAVLAKSVRRYREARSL